MQEGILRACRVVSRIGFGQISGSARERKGHFGEFRGSMRQMDCFGGKIKPVRGAREEVR